jgi:hypothetical protein
MAAAPARALLLLLLLLFALALLLQAAPSQAGDTVAAGRPLSGGDSLVSKRGKFRLGFFQPGTSSCYGFSSSQLHAYDSGVLLSFWCEAQIQISALLSIYSAICIHRNLLLLSK